MADAESGNRNICMVDTACGNKHVHGRGQEYSNRDLCGR